MAADDLSDWLEQHRDSLQTLVAGLNVSPRSTILPTMEVETQEFDLSDMRLHEPGEVVLLSTTLGEGGMGIVHLGTQTSLNREVAVKAIRKEVENPRRVAKLVQEAWVTSFLEHPNIVPIYDLTHDPVGRPLLVMRRIEGSPWKALLADPGAVTRQFGVADPLEWHLRVLMQLASALQFAHDKRILHLDLKPENVMIGPGGEVYLVDWGLALALPGGDPRLPQAADCEELLGTPAFFAPEMATGEGERLGTHTDVYLLGSTLYNVVAGRPPRVGDSLLSMIFTAVEGGGDPLPPDAPRELASIVRRAMKRNPGDRYASAQAFRRAIQRFLEHRGAQQLIDRATEQLEEVDRRVEAGAEDALVAELSAARFGFQQALAAWPQSEDAQAGFDRATGRYAIWCATRGDLATAEELAGQLSRAAPDVDAALAAERTRQQTERERMAELERVGSDHNVLTGQRTRLLVLGSTAFIGAAVPLVALVEPRIANYNVLLAYPIAVILLVGTLTVWGRESMTATRVNRAGTSALVWMSLAQLAVTYGAFRAGLAVDVGVSMVFPIWALTTGLFAVAVEPRFWPTASLYGLAALVTTLHPPAWPVTTALSNFAVLLNAGIIWRPGVSQAPTGS